MATKTKVATPLLTKLRAKFARQAKKKSLRNWSGTTQQFAETEAMGLTDKLTFGKHKSKTIRAILKEEPLYLVWILENTDLITVKQTVKQALADLGIKLKGPQKTESFPHDPTLDGEEDFDYNLSINLDAEYDTH